MRKRTIREGAPSGKPDHGGAEGRGAASGPVERLFPFLLRTRSLVVGRERLARERKKLLFLLHTTDLSEGSRREVRGICPGIPVIEAYTSEDIERHFGFRGTKVVGFLRNELTRSVLRELRGAEEPRENNGLNREEGGADGAH